MKSVSKFLIIVSICGLVLGLSACGASQNTSNNTASLTLKTYAVPQGRAKELSVTLDRVLSMGNDKNPIGRAWFSGSNQILVLAPTHMQKSIASSIKEIVGNGSSPANSPQPIHLDAWIVDAYPGNGPEGPALKAIQPALATFSRAMGPSHYVLVHYLTAVSDVGSRASVGPERGQVLFYTVNRNGGSLVLKFGYGPGLGLKGQVAIKLGQTLVLGLLSEHKEGGSSASGDAHAGCSVTGRVFRIEPGRYCYGTSDTGWDGGFATPSCPTETQANSHGA